MPSSLGLTRSSVQTFTLRPFVLGGDGGWSTIVWAFPESGLFPNFPASELLSTHYNVPAHIEFRQRKRLRMLRPVDLNAGFLGSMLTASVMHSATWQALPTTRDHASEDVVQYGRSRVMCALRGRRFFA